MFTDKIIFHATPRHWSAVINGKIVIRANILKENTKPVDTTGIELLPSEYFRLPDKIDELRRKVETAIGTPPTAYTPANTACWAKAEAVLKNASPAVVVRPYHIVADIPHNILIGSEANPDFVLHWTWHDLFTDIYDIAKNIIRLVDGEPIETAQLNCLRAFQRQRRLP
jgi:hypothetical protein